VGEYTVNRTPAFDLLAAEYTREHPKLNDDLDWLTGRLAEAPELMGDHVPELGRLALPVFKTRCKDSCHKIGASGAWRIYYALDKPAKKVFLLFLHHKKEYENPGAKFLLQKLERAIVSAAKSKSGASPEAAALD
jgi:hypothetical protein